MHRFANPSRFLRLSGRVVPWAAGATLLLMAAGLWFGLVASPEDYQQGQTVRIMYVHVPAAWMAMFVYAAMAAAAFVSLVWRHPLADLFCKAAAPLGAAFTAVCLVTGSLWGRPMWGTWWQWDGRMTSVLILFFLYLGYIALVHAFDDIGRGLRAGSVLLLVGVVNLPIIKFSVDWWNTLHQPASVLRLDGPTIDSAMLLPLFLMAASFTLYFVWLVLLRTRTEIAERKIRALHLAEADRAADPAWPPAAPPLAGKPLHQE